MATPSRSFSLQCCGANTLCNLMRRTAKYYEATPVWTKELGPSEPAGIPDGWKPGVAWLESPNGWAAVSTVKRGAAPTRGTPSLVPRNYWWIEANDSYGRPGETGGAKSRGEREWIAGDGGRDSTVAETSYPHRVSASGRRSTQHMEIGGD